MSENQISIEDQIKVIVNTAPVMIWMADTDKLCYYFNQTWLNFTGRTIAEESGWGWAESVHPDDLERCKAIYITSFDARKDFKMEYRLKRSDGKYRWLINNGVPNHNEKGHFLGYIGSCMDIDDLLESERIKKDYIKTGKPKEKKCLQKKKNNGKQGKGRKKLKKNKNPKMKRKRNQKKNKT